MLLGAMVTLYPPQEKPLLEVSQLCASPSASGRAETDVSIVLLPSPLAPFLPFLLSLARKDPRPCDLEPFLALCDNRLDFCLPLALAHAGEVFAAAACGEFVLDRLDRELRQRSGMNLLTVIRHLEDAVRFGILVQPAVPVQDAPKDAASPPRSPLYRVLDMAAANVDFLVQLVHSIRGPEFLSVPSTVLPHAIAVFTTRCVALLEAEASAPPTPSPRQVQAVCGHHSDLQEFFWGTRTTHQFPSVCASEKAATDLAAAITRGSDTYLGVTPLAALTPDFCGFSAAAVAKKVLVREGYRAWKVFVKKTDTLAGLQRAQHAIDLQALLQLQTDSEGTTRGEL